MSPRLAADVLHGFFQCLPAFHAQAFVEGQVGLVGHTEVGRSVDDGLVEGKDGFVAVQQMVGDFLDVRVQADAEE